jgi:oligoribonuclease (3'-5' exoribonuclease)
MPQDANHLIWIDMEMTGLRPETDRIIEVAPSLPTAIAAVAEAPVSSCARTTRRSPEWIPGTRVRTRVPA